MANNDYILVKDKEGKMKYFKDGKYFEIDEIDNPSPATTTVTPAVTTATPTVTVPVSPVDQKIETAVNGVISDLKITFTDPTIEKKFRNLVASRLREVRGDKEVKYFLTVPKEEGGFGLADKPAEAVLLIIKKYGDGLHTVSNAAVIPTPAVAEVNLPKPVVKPIEPPQEVDIVTPATPEPKASASQDDLNAAFDKLFAETIGKPLEVKPVPLPPVLPVAPTPTPESIPAPVARPILKVESAKTLDEVKWTPKLVGPVEELGTMDIVNFRRLGATPEESLTSIREKITNLSNESWIRGINGIRAWRTSPIYMVYASMGVEAIVGNLPISQVIVNRQVKNLPVLTSNEFIAINEFNHTLEM